MTNVSQRAVRGHLHQNFVLQLQMCSVMVGWGGSSRESTMKKWDGRLRGGGIGKELGHSRKHPYHPHRGNRKLTPLPPSDVLIHLLLSETIFPPPDGRNFLHGGSMDLFWNDPFQAICGTSPQSWHSNIFYLGLCNPDILTVVRSLMATVLLF